MQKYSTPAIIRPGSELEFGSVDVYLAADVDARIAELERGIDAAIEINNGHQQRIAKLEQALRWHVPTSHDKFCDVQDGKSKCNCGFDLLNRPL